MKKVVLFFSTLFLSAGFLYGQAGIDCSSAHSMNVGTFETINSSNQEYWISFIPSSADVNVTLFTDTLVPNFDSITVFSGSCSGLSSIATNSDGDHDRIIFFSIHSLSPGQQYFIQLQRMSTSTCRTCVSPSVDFTMSIDETSSTCPDLVCNGGFESFSSVPDCSGSPVESGYSINKVTCWHNAFQTSTDPYVRSADYFNVPTGALYCDNFTPGPHSGNVNAGMAFGRTSDPNYKEYLSSTPTTALTNGSYYCLRFFYGRRAGADATQIRTLICNSQYNADHAIGTIPTIVTETPVSNFYVEVDEYFQASSSSAVFLCVSFVNTPPTTNFNYYFIDDVSLTESIVFTSVSATTLCAGGTISLTAAGGSSYNWAVTPSSASLNPSGPNCTFTSSTPGTYTVTVSGTTSTSGCTSSASIIIKVLPSPSGSINISSGSNPLCAGDPITLNFNPHFNTVQWYNSSGPISGATAYTYSPTQAGDYYVIETSVNGCTFITNTITVNPAPSLSITGFNEHCFIANDGKAIVTASGGTAPYTFAWTPAVTNSTSGNTNTATGLNAGTYSVTVTDAKGCSVSGSVTISTTPPVATPVIISNALNNNLCNSNVITYAISNPGIGVTYTSTFNPTPLSVVSPLSNVWVVTWPDNCNDAVITVNAYNVNPVCSATSSYTVYACCSCSRSVSDAIMTGDAAHDDLNDFLATYNPGNSTSGIIYHIGQNWFYNNPNHLLYLNGIFNVDASYVNSLTFMPGSEVRMGGNAKIQIIGTQACTVNINQSHFAAGCSDMWDGIYFSGTNKTLNVTGGNVRVSLIEDAQNGLVSSNGSTYTIDNTIFNKNYIAIQALNYSQNHQGTIRNSVITCRNLPANPTITLLKGPQTSGFIQVYPVGNYSAATLLAPYTGLRSSVGIKVDHIGNTILSSSQVAFTTGISIGVGTTYANINVFDNLDYGVYSSLSNLTVDNNAFQFITGPVSTAKNTPETGIAIYGIGDGHPGSERVIVIGNGQSGIRNTFYNCNRGVDINAYYKITLLKNRFESTQIYSPLPVSTQSPIGNYAAFIKTGNYISIDVTNNDIVNWNIGIALFGDVVINSPTQQFKFFGDARINNNRVCPTETNFGTITTQAVRQAIMAQNIIPPCAPSCLQQSFFGRLYIDDNDLNNVFNGISVQGWLRIPQIASTVNGSQNIYLRYQAPFIVSVFPQAGIRTINTDAPVIYNNHINGSSQNLTKTLVRGIYVTTCVSSIVKCNDITNMGQCMVFEGLSAGSTVFKNYMNTSQDGFVLLNNGNIGPQGSLPIPIVLPFGQSNDNQWVGPFTHAATFTDHTFAPNTHSPFYYRLNNPVEHPVGGLNLTWSGGIPGVDDYNVSGGFSQVPVNAHGTNCNLPPALVVNGSGQPNQQQSLQRIIQDTTLDSAGVWLGKQQVYFMLRKDPSWMNSSVTLQQFFAVTQSTTIAALDSVDVELSENNLVSAISVNGTINAQLIVEQNQRIVNDIYSSVMNGNIATAQQISDISDIAYQCPLTGGNGVYRARTLLCLMLDDVIFFEDSCNVLPSGARIIRPQEQTGLLTNNTCMVYPNPNDGQMTLSYAIDDQKNVSFSVFDMTGRALVQYNLVSGSQIANVDLTKLATGMYYYIFYVDGKPEKSEKIIISK